MKDNTRYHAKVRAYQLKQIKQLLIKKVKQQSIAKEFGVSQPTIARYNKILKEEKILS